MPVPFLRGLPLPGYRANSRDTPSDQFVDVAGTDLRAYGIDSAGRLWAWGKAPLGDGLFRDSDEPVLIDDGPWRTVRGNHGIKEDGSLWVLSGRVIPEFGFYGWNPGWSVDTKVSRGVASVDTNTRDSYYYYLRYNTDGFSRAPHVRIDPPEMPGGVQATAIAHAQCSLHAIEILSGGFGYTEPPAVELVGEPSAILRAYVENGSVVAVAIISPGSFMLAGADDDPPAISFRSSSGQGAAARGVFMCAVTRVEVTNAGSGYTGEAPSAEIYEENSPLAPYLSPGRSFSYIRKTSLTGGPVVGLSDDRTVYGFNRTVVGPPYGGVYTPSSRSLAQITVTGLRWELVGFERDPDVCAYMEFSIIEPSRLSRAGRLEDAIRAYGSAVSLNDYAFFETPEVSVVGGDYGSGAEVEIAREEVEEYTPGYYELRYQIKITARGSGYDYAPAVRVRGRAVKHKLVVAAAGYRVEVERELEVDHYYHVLSVSPPEPPPIELGSDTPGVTAVATTVLEPTILTTGTGGWPLFSERVTDVTVTDAAGQHSQAPRIFNATGIALRPRNLADVHPEFARSWRDIRSGVNDANQGLAAVDESGVVWTCVYQRYGSSFGRGRLIHAAPRPIGADYVVAENAAGLALPNAVPPSRAGIGQSQQFVDDDYSFDSFSSHLQEPLGVPFSRFSMYPPVRKLGTTDEDSFYPSNGMRGIAESGELIGFAPRYYHGSELAGQWAWYDEKLNVGLVDGVLKRSNGGSTYAGGPGQTAVDCRGGVARTPDGSLALLDPIRPNLVKRWIGGQAIEILDAGSGYRGPIFAETPVYDSATVATWPPYRGGVYAIGVLTQGSGYQSAPEVTIEDAEGYGAYAEAVIEGAVDRVTVTAGGSGYTSPPTVAFSRPGIDAEAVAEIRDGQVVAVRVTDGGLYRSPPAVTFIGGGGSGAAATATIDGRLEYVKVLDAGQGYTQGATATVPGGATLQCQVLCRYVPPETFSTFTNTDGYNVLAASWRDYAFYFEYLGRPLLGTRVGTPTSALTALAKLPALYTGPPTIFARRAPALQAVTQARVASHAFSLPLYREMQEVSPGDLYNLGRAVEWAGVPRPQDIWLPTMSTGTLPQYWWYWHDGEITAELLSPDGYGVRGTAVRNADGTIARWEWSTENATSYTLSQSYYVARRRSLIGRIKDPYGYPEAAHGSECRVRGPAEGRPAAAVAVVEPVTVRGETRYRVLRVEVTARGKYRGKPTAWLVAGNERAPLNAVMSAPAGYPSLATNYTNVNVYSPPPASFVAVGGRQAPSGNYYELPLFIGGNRTWTSFPPRYWEVEQLEVSSPERLWSSPPEVVVDDPPRYDSRWYASVTAPPDALPLGVRYGTWKEKYAGSMTTTGTMQRGAEGFGGRHLSENCILPILSDGVLADVWIVNDLDTRFGYASFDVLANFPSRMNESEIVLRGECDRPARARIVRPRFATGNEFVQAAFVPD